MLLRRGGRSAVCGADPPLVTVGRAALPDVHRRRRGLLPRRPLGPSSRAGGSERPPPSDDDRVPATWADRGLDSECVAVTQRHGCARSIVGRDARAARSCAVSSSAVAGPSVTAGPYNVSLWSGIDLGQPG